MCEHKSNFGTNNINSHGTGGGSSTDIEKTGTGIPDASVDQNGTGRPGQRRLGGAARAVLLSLVLLFGWAHAAVAGSHYQADGLSLYLAGDEVTVSWIRADGRLVLARGELRDGYASLPLTLVAVDRYGKVQESGSGPDGDKRGGPAFEGGRIELIREAGVSGRLVLSFGDSKEELLFAFDAKGQFLQKLAVR